MYEVWKVVCLHGGGAMVSAVVSRFDQERPGSTAEQLHYAFDVKTTASEGSVGVVCFDTLEHAKAFCQEAGPKVARPSKIAAILRCDAEAKPRRIPVVLALYWEALKLYGRGRELLLGDEMLAPMHVCLEAPLGTVVVPSVTPREIAWS